MKKEKEKEKSQQSHLWLPLWGSLAAAAAKSLQSCQTVRPHRRPPTRLPHPWDSPGKNTGVGCNFLLQCIKVKSEREVAQSFPTLRDPVDCSLPGSSVHGIFQAKVLEWGAIALSREGAWLSVIEVAQTWELDLYSVPSLRLWLYVSVIELPKY